MFDALFEYISLEAMLTMIKVELELISDADMFFLFEKGIRGGVSYISNRYSPKQINTI